MRIDWRRPGLDVGGFVDATIEGDRVVIAIERAKIVLRAGVMGTLYGRSTNCRRSSTMWRMPPTGASSSC